MRFLVQPLQSLRPHLQNTFLALLAAILSTGCTAPRPDAPPTSDTPAADSAVLRVGITPNVPPMIFKEGGNYLGIEAELAGQLGQHLGRTVRFVEVPWESQIDALLANRTDIIMSSMSITGPRQIRIQFSQPYLRAGQAALVRREEAGKLQVTFFSEKIRVGVQESTTGDYFVQQYMPRAIRKTYSNAAQAAQDLARDKIDALLHDAPVIWWLASENENAGLTLLPELLTEEVLAWGLRKHDTDLLNSVNQFLSKAHQDGSLNRIVQRWIPKSTPP